MHNKRKGIVAVIMVFVLSFALLGPSVSGAESNVIYETSEKQTITRGVVNENIVKYTTSGWLNINILRVDLSDEYIKIDTLTNPDSAGKLASVKTLANNSGALAAVNGSFFSSSGGGKGYPLGPIIKSGNVACASKDFNTYGDSMASFSLTKLNEVILNYWRCDISLTAPTGTVIPIARYNKVNGSQYSDFTLMDRKWGMASVGVSEALPDIVEMVVDGGVVTQILVSQPAVTIPENGYVVITRTAGGKQLTDNFKVGDPVTMNIKTDPDWSNISMSVTGSSILVKDGQIPPKFSFDTPEMARNQPRTVIASTQDGKTLMLVTVDGRQNSSIGMTQEGIAKYMLELGAYNALNMDGGGSTTMVARQAGQTSLSIVNSPSDGLARGVSNGIGVFSTAPVSDLAGLQVEIEDANIFVNTSRAISVKGYDKYFNPIPINPEQVKWSVSGVKGSFVGNAFKPTSYGEAKITAKIGTFAATNNISVLSSPVKLILSENTIKLPVGKAKSFTVKGYNKNGYSTSINPEDVKWAVKGKIGAFDRITFTASARGTGYIDAYIGKTHAYCAVSVSDDITTVRDKFEASNGTFLSYPETVTGNYTVSDEQKVSGKTSGKLAYDFTNTEGTRAAYMVLPKGGMTLEKGVSKLSLQVYNDHENSNWLRAEILDANGEKQYADFSKNMDWIGWKQVEASTESIKMPAKLTRIYLAQINPVAESGSIYLDDLTSTNSGYPAIDMSKIPKDTVPADESNKAVSFSKATADSFRFGVFGQSRIPETSLEKKLVTKYAEKIDKYMDAAVIIGNGFHDSVTKLIKKKPVISLSTINSKTTKETDYKYSYKDIKNSRFFKMDIRKNGLRLSDSSQWQQFLTDLNGFTGSNVFILLESNPNKFSDTLELNLFKQTLTKYRQKTGKAVWVFYKGDKNESYMDRGIKYISTAGYDAEGLTSKKTSPATYVVVTVKGKTVTYAFRPII